MNESAWIGAVPDTEQACRLAVPGGHDAPKLHVTLGFFRQTAAELGEARREEVRGLLKGFGDLVSWPVTARIVGRMVLPTPKGRWEAYALASPALNVLAGAVALTLDPELDHTYPWLPHMTFRRLPGGQEPTAGALPLKHLEFRELQLAWGDLRARVSPRPGAAAVRI